MTKPCPRLLSTLLIAASVVQVALAASVSPMDGLSVAEYETVATVLRESGNIDDSSRFARVALAEPDKQQVLAWQPGDPVQRRAFVAVRHQRQLYEGIVDIDARRLVSWERIDGAQPALLESEFILTQQIVRASEVWQDAVRDQGIDNYKTVFCFPVLPGNFGLPRDADNRRIAMVSCNDTRSKIGLRGRPLSGLLVVVDYDTREIVELIDTGNVPTPASGPAVNPDQPNRMPERGPVERRFTISDHWIEWDKWRFHLRIDPRVGPVLSQVSIADGERRRSVMYQGSISEMFVPYMDPGELWYFRNYLDVGEYGIGSTAVTLRSGMDCPADSAMLDAACMSDRGEAYTKERIVCVFERETGDAAWTHYEIANNGSLLRRHTELVVRFIVWLGNYDYVIDWIFTETGSVKGRVGANGIVQIKSVTTQNMSAKTAEQDTAYGRLITPGLVAINHDHFFGFRLDLDIDGATNNMRIDRLRRVDVAKTHKDSPRKQIWQLFSEDVAREDDAKLNVDLPRPAVWRVVNPAVTNRVGNPVSYQLQPGVTGRTLMDDG